MLSSVDVRSWVVPIARAVFVCDSKLRSSKLRACIPFHAQTARQLAVCREHRVLLLHEGIGTSTCIYGSHRSQPNRCTQRRLLLSRTPTATSSSPPFPSSDPAGVPTGQQRQRRGTLAGRRRKRQVTSTAAAAPPPQTTATSQQVLLLHASMPLRWSWIPWAA
jgi:hypothetical protein